MPHVFPTPQDAEDAFYDAFDEGDLDALMAVWEESDDARCLLPMSHLVSGAGNIRAAFKPIFTGEHRLSLEVRHQHWVESDEFALHFLEEIAAPPGGGQKMPPVYALNAYRKGDKGWKMLAHMNSPTPPPPGMMPGMPQ